MFNAAARSERTHRQLSTSMSSPVKMWCPHSDCYWHVFQTCECKWPSATSVTHFIQVRAGSCMYSLTCALARPPTLVHHSPTRTTTQPAAGGLSAFGCPLAQRLVTTLDVTSPFDRTVQNNHKSLRVSLPTWGAWRRHPSPAIGALQSTVSSRGRVVVSTEGNILSALSLALILKLHVTVGTQTV